MAFPAIYKDDEKCPLEGYDGYAFRVLVNPSGDQLDDLRLGHLGGSDCSDCTEQTRCPRCAEARMRYGRAMVAFFGQSKVKDFDFSTPEAALASLEQPGLPDEFLYWLLHLPEALFKSRRAELKKKLSLS